MKNNINNETPIRIPVKLIDGVWEYFYGGGLPIEDGAIGSLHVDKHSIHNEQFLSSLKQKSAYKILDEGSALLVALTIKSRAKLDENLRGHLTHSTVSYDTFRSADYCTWFIST